MKSSHYIAIAIAVFSVVWIISGFLFEKPQEDVQKAFDPKTPVQKELVQVRIKISEAQDYTDNVVVTGRSKASRNIELKAEIEGQFQEVLKEEGDLVEKDDILARIETRDREARLKEAQGRVAQRDIEYNAAKKLEHKGFNSKVRLAQASADLQTAKADLEKAKLELEKTDIKAPFEGVIYRQEVEVGDYVSIGDTVFSLVDLNPIEFEAYVSEQYIQEIEVGREAYAEFLNGEKISSKIYYIAPAADPQTRTFRIVLRSENPDHKIKEGMTAKVIVPLSAKKAHKISPSILSLDDVGRIGVKIVSNDDIVTFVPVKILADKTEAMWIYGPSDAARIITVGQDFVAEGQKVKAIVSDDEGLL